MIAPAEYDFNNQMEMIRRGPAAGIEQAHISATSGPSLSKKVSMTVRGAVENHPAAALAVAAAVGVAAGWLVKRGGR